MGVTPRKLGIANIQMHTIHCLWSADLPSKDWPIPLGFRQGNHWFGTCGLPKQHCQYSQGFCWTNHRCRTSEVQISNGNYYQWIDLKIHASSSNTTVLPSPVSRSANAPRASGRTSRTGDNAKFSILVWCAAGCARKVSHAFPFLLPKNTTQEPFEKHSLPPRRAHPMPSTLKTRKLFE